MSDCRHGGRDAYERPYELPNGSVVFLEDDEVPAFVSIVFADEDELTRDFPLLLGGREISHVEIDGQRYERREECERVPFDASASPFLLFVCNRCGRPLEHNDVFCPKCGAKIKED